MLFDRSVLARATVILNGGQHGLQIELMPGDVVTALGAVVADVAVAVALHRRIGA